MGISIYYQGTLDQIADVAVLSEEVTEFASILGWEIRRWNGDWSRPNTAALAQRTDGFELTGHVPLRGVSLLADPDCEPLFLTFNRKGALASTTNMLMDEPGSNSSETFWLSTTTQFTSSEVHIALVKLLKYLKSRYISDMQVYDETGYWNHEDRARVVERFKNINTDESGVTDTLNLIPKRILDNKTPEQIADFIENMIRKKFGG